jgi:Fe-Mn family superoxide dismutase
MELHHSKHHQTYVTSLNNALKNYSVAQRSNDVPTQIQLQPIIKFHGGGHINHSLFWQNLAPPKSAQANTSAAPKLIQVIQATWGSEDAFKKKFNAALLGIQGSGWGWLVKFDNENGRLGIVITKDQDPIVGPGEIPIFGVDMWEHAYYLQVGVHYSECRPSCTDNSFQVP